VLSIVLLCRCNVPSLNACRQRDVFPDRSLDACPALPAMTELDLSPAAHVGALRVETLHGLSRLMPRLRSLKVDGWRRRVPLG